MKKALIFAVALAFSQFAFANEPAKSAEMQCAAGTKLVRGAQINIAKDGSGYLVEHDSCEPVESPEDTAKATVKPR